MNAYLHVWPTRDEDRSIAPVPDTYNMKTTPSARAIAIALVASAFNAVGCWSCWSPAPAPALANQGASLMSCIASAGIGA